MLSRRACQTLSRATRPTTQLQPISRASFSTSKTFKATGDPEIDDPGMNGGYINPPRIKRQHRDPYGDWTDKQERRNFGEPVHEDEDVLGIFALEDYTYMSSRRGLLLWGGFIACVGAVTFGVRATLPDKPSSPKEYPDGLAAELGGPGSLRAHKAGDEVYGVKL